MWEKFLPERWRKKVDSNTPVLPLPVFYVSPGTELRISEEAVLRVESNAETLPGFVKAKFWRIMKNGSIEEGSKMQLNLEAFNVKIDGVRHKLEYRK